MGLAIVGGVLILGFLALHLVPAANREQQFGVQFSKAHAEWLGLDWRAAYLALLDDLDVPALRLGAYWNEVEPTRGSFDFTSLDWLLNEAARRDARVILAAGRRLPRWPECHVPQWAKALPEPEQRQAILAYLTVIVERYRSYPAVQMWQVENEPLLNLFGECPKGDAKFLAEEVALVRRLDSTRQILITDSGELSTWMRTATAGDVLGTTMYRVVWNRWFGYWTYDWILPPAFYRLKAWIVGKTPETMIVAELQAEPWIPKGDLRGTPLDEHRRSMDARRFRKNAATARATGFREVYLWGSEYWYWLKEVRGDDSLWEEARAVLRPVVDPRAPHTTGVSP